MYEDNPNFLRQVDYLTRAIRTQKWNTVDDWLKDPNIDLAKKQIVLKSKCLTDQTFFGAHANPFHWACLFEAPSHILNRMIDVGGEDMLADKDTVYKSNGLIWAATNRGSLDVVQNIVSVDKNLITGTNRFGNNAVHMACRFNTDYEVIHFLFKTGGPEILTARNDFGEIPLHHACRYHFDLKVTKEMVSGPQGQMELLKIRDSNGLSSLAHAFEGEGSKELINFLLDEFDDHSGDDLLHKNTGSMLTWTNAQPQSIKAEFLKKHFIRRVLNSYFSHPLFLGILMCDFYSQLVLVWVYSFGIGAPIIQGSKALDNGHYFLLNIAIAWRVLREVLQIMTKPLDLYIVEAKYLMDITLLILVLRSSFSLSQAQELTNSEGVWICITTGFVWIHLIMVMSRLRYEVAVFVRAVKQIIFKLVPFYLITMLVVFSFGNMFYIATLVEKRECPINDNDIAILEGWTCNIWESYFTTFTMLLSTDWIYFNQPSLSLSTVIAMTFATIIGILLLNILIAEIGVVWSDVTEMGRLAFWSIRLSFIVEISLSFSSLCRLDARMISSSFESKALSSAESTRRIHLNSLSVVRYKDMESTLKVSPEERQFFLWYRNFTDANKPSFWTRMKVFLTRASISEILVPGKSFERVLSTNLQLSRVLLLLFYPVIPISLAITFTLGLLSWGFLWPRPMKKFLFDGPVVETADVRKTVEDTKESITKLKEEVEEMQMKLDRVVDLLKKSRDEWS